MTVALVIVACILFALAGAGVPSGRVSLIGLGLAFWSLASVWHTLW